MPRIRQKDDAYRTAETGTDHVNVDRFLKVWGEILSDHYGVNIKLTATKKAEIAEKNIQEGGVTA